jgi:hypothetical protein
MHRIDYDGINSWASQEWDKAEKRMISAVIEAMNDGEIQKCSLNYEWVICDSCRGNGSHSKHLGVISHEDLIEWDEEDFYNYRSGVYDQICDRCNGSGKVKELNMDVLPQEVVDYIESYYKMISEDIAIRRSEMMMGA